MNSTELNICETSFVPTTGVNVASNSFVNSALGFDGFIQNCQLQQQFEDNAEPFDIKENATSESVGLSSSQLNETNVGKNDTVITQKDDMSSAQYQEPSVTEEAGMDKHGSSDSLGKIAHTKLNDLETVTTVEPKDATTPTLQTDNRNRVSLTSKQSTSVESSGKSSPNELRPTLLQQTESIKDTDDSRTKLDTIETPDDKKAVEQSHRHVEHRPEVVVFDRVGKNGSTSLKAKNDRTSFTTGSINSAQPNAEQENSDKVDRSKVAHDQSESHKPRQFVSSSQTNSDHCKINENFDDSKSVRTIPLSEGRSHVVNQLSTSFGTLLNVSMTKMVKRITQFVQKSISTQSIHTNIKLDGGRLGSMEIQYSKNDTTKQITIVVETEAARDTIQKLIPAINNNLGQKGVQPSSIDVQVSNYAQEDNHEREQKRSMTQKRLNKTNNEQLVVNDLSIAMKDYGYNTIEILA